MQPDREVATDEGEGQADGDGGDERGFVGHGDDFRPSMHQRARSDVRYALLANDATPRASAAVAVEAAPIQEGPMHIGVVFPQVEIGPDPARIRDYAQAVEGMGYTHMLAFDHVLGANPERPGGWKGPYTHVTRSTSRSCSSAFSPA